IRPMVARSRGRICLLSSAYGQRGCFFEIWSKGGADWQRVKITASEVPSISPEFLASERRQLGETWYMQEYGCVFCATVDAVFDPLVVERALEANTRPLFLGSIAD